MKRCYGGLVSLALLGGMGSAWAEPGQVHHVVVAWLKEPGSHSARSRYVEISRGLAKLPGVVSYSVGAAVPSPHALADDSYDVAVAAVFKDKKALEDYNANPAHRKAVDDMRPLVQKLVVYDFVE
ncbi:Dabb family protein [Methylogaea oryzae]|uniref:Stress-response A/B barrel domain-containing protein n=1 Tax=Methylogaea oryzae TaxID=1295382 RepID=A0A8D4VLB2_9GAMM|nr:Dabb family protein [Methylogaea oryzae]BBL69948.1 hypothetical protein MoryE10_05540 [Methylogaea oryzae]